MPSSQRVVSSGGTKTLFLEFRLSTAHPAAVGSASAICMGPQRRFHAGVDCMTDSVLAAWPSMASCDTGLGRLRSRSVRAIVLLLMFGLWPGAAEALVDVGHLVMNGDTSHGQVCDDGETSGQAHTHDEHQCSVLFHLCGCHTTPPTSTSTRVAFNPTQTGWSEFSVSLPSPIGALVKLADGALTRATRPPIV
jgi:hypothetical protein